MSGSEMLYYFSFKEFITDLIEPNILIFQVKTVNYYINEFCIAQMCNENGPYEYVTYP